MTLAQLLGFLDAQLPYPYLLDGDAEATLRAAEGGTHPDALVGEVIRRLAAAAADGGATSPIERAAAVNALGPLRLQYMADDAPVEGFRLVERTIVAIDEAFDAEALAAKRQGGA